MNKRDQKALSNLYKSAPRLESPDSLDQRILQNAEKFAPKKKSMLANNWMPALGSACLVGIALYIAMPIFKYEDRARQSLEIKQDIQLEERVEADSVSAVAPASLPAEQKLQKSQQAGEKEVGDSDAAPAQRIDDESKSKSISSPAKNSSQAKPATVVSEAESSLQSQAESFRAQATQTYLSIDEIDRKLGEIRNLANRQLLDQAQKLLDELIQLCPDCELPATVAELE